MSVKLADKVHVFYLLGKQKTPVLSLIHTESVDSQYSILQPSSLDQQPLSSPNNIPYCRCRKSQCLQLKCSCFRRQGMCSPYCACVGCCNNDSNIELRNNAIELTREVFNNAFKSPEVIPLNHTQVVNVGCNCKKSSCKNKYCPCFRAEAECSNLCSCRQCTRQKVSLDFNNAPLALRRQKNRRKRLKIVCNNKHVELRKYSKFEILRIREEKSILPSIQSQP